MRDFRWLEGPGQLESLAVCLRSLSALLGSPASYDDIVVALGLGSLVVADSRHSLRDWPALARDELLVATAEHLGVRLRDLHPRRAAVGLEASAEYRLHFVDSYVPLIERALACEQLAIVWCGWPSPRDMQWGVITACRAGVVSGYTLGHSGEPLSLTLPAQQVYIVEEFSPRAAPLPASDRFARAAWAICAQETGMWCSDPAMLSGSRAWREWAAQLDGGEGGPARVRVHRSAVVPVAAAHESLCRALSELAGSLSGGAQESAVRWAELDTRVAQRLRQTVPPAGAPLPDASSWRSATVQALRELADLGARAAEIVAPHARAIAVRPAYEPDPLQV